MRLTFVQYGDYREAYERLKAGGEETYFAQRYTVDFVTDLAKRLDHVAVIAVMTQPHEPVELCNGVTAVGLRMGGESSTQDLIRAVKAQQPTHVVVRGPMDELIKPALGEPWQVLAMLADSFESKGLRAMRRHWRLRRVLRDPRLPWVGNHGIMASRSLARIGVPAEKIIPYDIAAQASPDDFAPKQSHPPSDRPWRMTFAGSVTRDKGVGDAIDAVRLLGDAGHEVELTILGEDRGNEFHNYASSAGVADQVKLPGRVGHDKVLETMHSGDIVVVPSRHAYPEGIPYAIYDAYCSRAPLIASDHPMFRENVIDGESGLVFKASDAQSLADTIVRLATDESLYRRLSQNSAQAWRRLLMKAEWGEVIERFLEGEAGNEWFASHALPTIEAERARGVGAAS